MRKDILITVAGPVIRIYVNGWAWAQQFTWLNFADMHGALLSNATSIRIRVKVGN